MRHEVTQMESVAIHIDPPSGVKPMELRIGANILISSPLLKFFEVVNNVAMIDRANFLLLCQCPEIH